MIITKKQQKEIEQLIPEHAEALVAYGADMYRRGMLSGAFWITVGFSCGTVIGVLINIHKQRKSEEENKRES